MPLSVSVWIQDHMFLPPESIIALNQQQLKDYADFSYYHYLRNIKENQELLTAFA